MSVLEALKEFDLVSPGRLSVLHQPMHQTLITALVGQAGRVRSIKSSAKDWVFVTNTSTYYTFTHPNEFDDKNWENAVSVISDMRDVCGEPEGGLYFELRGHHRLFSIENVLDNRRFITALINKVVPRRSIRDNPNLIEEDKCSK